MFPKKMIMLFQHFLYVIMRSRDHFQYNIKIQPKIMDLSVRLFVGFIRQDLVLRSIVLG